MAVSGIYTITNLINGKMYIGKAYNIYKRWAMHLSLLRRNKSPNKYLQESWNKYGEINFAFEILEDCSLDLLNALEHYWCVTLNLTDRKYGYNLESTHPYKKSYGPMEGKSFSVEHKKKLSLSHIGKKVSEETRLKQSMARIGKPAPTKGIILSQERKDIILKANKGRISPQRIKIEVKGQIYDGYTEASKIIGISLHTIRNRCMNPKFEDYKIIKNEK